MKCLKIDTVQIIEAWLTEVNSYDTTITLADGSLQATWFNYQNVTEEAAFTYTSNVQKAPMYGVGVHASIEAQTDFIENVAAIVWCRHTRRHSEKCILLQITSSMVTIMLV